MLLIHSLNTSLSSNLFFVFLFLCHTSWKTWSWNWDWAWQYVQSCPYLSNCTVNIKEDGIIHSLTYCPSQLLLQGEEIWKLHFDIFFDGFTDSFTDGLVHNRWQGLHFLHACWVLTTTFYTTNYICMYSGVRAKIPFVEVTIGTRGRRSCRWLASMLVDHYFHHSLLLFSSTCTSQPFLIEQFLGSKQLI